MAQIINTNVLSLTAQRNLTSSQGALQTSLQRLSSGLRINSAKDDAAGLAISERFTTQIRGLNQAVRNANDGISLSQTAEGALAEMNNNLQRIRELAVQSANATNSSSDRTALDQEVQQRLAEINRIANQTSFNGQKILDGTFGDAKFQVGANVGETIDLSLNTSMRLDSIGSVAQATSVDLGTLIIEGSDAVDAVATTSGAPTGVASNWVSDTDGQAFTLTIDGTNVYTATQASGTPETVDAATLDTNIASFVSGSSGAYTQSGTLAGGDLVISKADGTDMVIAVTSDFGTAGSFDEAGFVGTQTDGTEAEAAVPASPFTLTELTLQIGDADAVNVPAGDYDTAQELVDAVNLALSGEGTAALNDDGTMTITSQQTITVGGSDAATVFDSGTEFAASGDLTTVNVLTQDAANDAIYRMDSALTSVSDLRSTFGAIQNRFESTITNLSTTSENLEASRSRIRDADFAAETADLTRAQILQQAGISVLAQANAVPQSVLALLQ